MLTVESTSCLPSFLSPKAYPIAQAHASYWADGNFAAFVLAEIFAKKEDRARTGLGSGVSPPHGFDMGFKE